MSLEVCERLLGVLKEADAGNIPIVMVNAERFKEDSYWGTPIFHVGGWEFAVFNDCASWDYIESAIDPEGRSYDYSDLCYGPLGDWIPEDLKRWGLQGWEG